MILSVDQISHAYGKQQVLREVAFSIEQPKILALVGPNGAGKSTLLNVIANLIRPDQGEVHILGKSNQEPDIFREYSYMQDNTVLYDYLTGYDHLQFIAEVQRLTKKDIKLASERIGTDGFLDKKVSSYSLGMKQLLLLTMAIVNRPKLLVLDEPLNGLDPTNAIKVRNLFLDLVAEGTAILLSSHNLAEIDRVTSDVLFLKDGQLLHENLKELEQTFYKLSVDEPKRAISELVTLGVTAEEDHEQPFNLKVTLGDTWSVSQVFRTLDHAGVTIHDLEKVILGSENRYRMLYEE